MDKMLGKVVIVWKKINFITMCFFALSEKGMNFNMENKENKKTVALFTLRL